MERIRKEKLKFSIITQNDDRLSLTSYIGNLENIILENSNIELITYARYADDIFLEVISENQINTSEEAFENITVLKFTYEMNINNKLLFLNVILNNSGDIIRNKVYRKKSDKEQCFLRNN